MKTVDNINPQATSTQIQTLLCNYNTTKILNHMEYNYNYLLECVCVCWKVCVWVCVCACLHVCMRVSMRMHACVFALSALEFILKNGLIKP